MISICADEEVIRLTLCGSKFMQERDLSIESLRMLEDKLLRWILRRCGVDFESVRFGYDQVFRVGREEREFECVPDGGGSVDGCEVGHGGRGVVSRGAWRCLR